MIDTYAGPVIQSGARVLIKPNWLIAAKPEKAILTHPLVVKAAVEYVLAKNARVLIADSPAVGSVKRIYKLGGYAKALAGLDVEWKEFQTSTLLDIGEPFGKIQIAADALEADVVINLPKLKTHTQMLLTLGVKNMFGCIVGFRKPEWHLRSGIDRDAFARLLVQIYRALNPTITIVDGILAMEGQGPGKSGSPRYLGALIASDDAIAGDLAICNFLNVDPRHLPTHRAALHLGCIPHQVEIQNGLTPISDFKIPELGRLKLGPKLLHGFMRKHLLQRPVAAAETCQVCGECSQYCPAQAISQNKVSIHFDYDQCIRCYCCIEVCPHGALRAVETLPGKVLRWISHRR